jgi:predicted outer membrane protein
MFKQLLAGAAAVLLCAAPAFAAADPPLPDHDRLYLQHESRASAYERALSELALQRTGSTPIKHFALRDLYDHDKLRTEAQRIATRHDITLDTTLTAPQARRVAALRGLRGLAFNTAYMRDLRQFNSVEKPLFQQEAEGIQNHQVQQLLEQAQDDDQTHARMLDHLLIQAGNARAARTEHAADAGL